MAWQPDYADTEQVKAYVRVGDDQDDEQLALSVTAASRAIDDATNRQFGQHDEPVARYYTARFDYARRRWFVDIDDLMDETGLEVRFDSDEDGSYSDEITEYRLTPRNAEADGRPWTRIEVPPGASVTPTRLPDGVEVTARFGWSEVPEPIVQATLLQASRFLFRRDAPAGIAGSPDQGSELRLLARVDPDVDVAVRPYARPRRRVG